MGAKDAFRKCNTSVTTRAGKDLVAVTQLIFTCSPLGGIMIYTVKPALMVSITTLSNIHPACSHQPHNIQPACSRHFYKHHTTQYLQRFPPTFLSHYDTYPKTTNDTLQACVSCTRQPSGKFTHKTGTGPELVSVREGFRYSQNPHRHFISYWCCSMTHSTAPAARKGQIPGMARPKAEATSSGDTQSPEILEFITPNINIRKVVDPMKRSSFLEHEVGISIVLGLEASYPPALSQPR